MITLTALTLGASALVMLLRAADEDLGYGGLARVLDEDAEQEHFLRTTEEYGARVFRWTPRKH